MIFLYVNLYIFRVLEKAEKKAHRKEETREKSVVVYSFK